MDDVIDTHIHLSHAYALGGLPNSWQPSEPAAFQRDYTEEHYLDTMATGAFRVKGAVFVQCFNEPPVEEARWVLRMIEDPRSVVIGLTACIAAQKGAAEVNGFLDQLRGEGDALPAGLKAARMVFMVGENQTPQAPVDPRFLDGLEALQSAGLTWEFCTEPFMAPAIAECCARFPGMPFVLDHLVHNGMRGGEMEVWGPAIDALGKLPNVCAKLSGCDEWGVEDPTPMLDRAIAAFGFDRLLYGSNWFCNEAKGEAFDKTAVLVKAACERHGAGPAELRKVFRDNALRVYKLDQ
eukprot:NODE_13096_length_1185_cov_5.037807.p1 GENE.NODE_13096_length_1185_cov_5.037807~~NODE_13096_length_1185_cov_5.037807.p1  ORF type:complete len:301 (+),score=104.02 NODE_13096_length_1185_cov_5.037807:22-903(+)